jgi:hypothetical protein
MPWLRESSGLKLAGTAHFDAGEIRQLLVQLRQSRNQPATVCRQIEDCLTTGRAPRKLIWRLSKWCHWDDSSEEIARRIANQLFHGEICRRLLDQQDKPINDPRPAEEDYQDWLIRVVAASRARAGGA